METKQLAGIAGIISALLGLLVIPLAAEKLFNVDAIQVLFVVIIFYYLAGQVMKRKF